MILRGTDATGWEEMRRASTENGLAFMVMMFTLAGEPETRKRGIRPGKRKEVSGGSIMWERWKIVGKDGLL